MYISAHLHVYTSFHAHVLLVLSTDSRRALSQRESELLDSSDQCRAMLEETISDLRKNNATLEHQLTIARDDTKTLQATFTEKVVSEAILESCYVHVHVRLCCTLHIYANVFDARKVLYISGVWSVHVLVMPRCACVCVCIECYSCSKINEVEVRVL